MNINFPLASTRNFKYTQQQKNNPIIINLLLFSVVTAIYPVVPH
jgi:hypothetical protein